MVERGVGLVKKKRRIAFSVFFFNDTATTEIYTLSLHDALPIWRQGGSFNRDRQGGPRPAGNGPRPNNGPRPSAPKEGGAQ